MTSRVVRTVEELRELPDPRVFEDRHGNVCVAVKDGYYVAGVTGLKPLHRAALPATVLAPTQSRPTVEEVRVKLEALVKAVRVAHYGAGVDGEPIEAWWDEMMVNKYTTAVIALFNPEEES